MAYTGVNLGGWLVLERWITPSLFKGMKAKDEYTLIQEAGVEAKAMIEHHRKTFITTADLEWLKANGIQAVRVPVPFWIFGGGDHFFEGTEYLDWLMDEARRLDIKVVLEQHAAIGSQNGKDHSGKAGAVRWHRSNHLIAASLNIVELLAMRYSGSRQLVGIGLLNEPSKIIDQHLLEVYYQEGYKRVRKYCSSDVAVIINDQFDPSKWQEFMVEPEYENVWLDTHLYQAFDAHSSIEKVLQKVNDNWRQLIEDIQAIRPLMIGEWSLGLDDSVFRDMTHSEKEQALREFYEAQLSVFSKATAQFFWTYKTENMLGWSYKDLKAKKLIPSGVQLKDA